MTTPRRTRLIRVPDVRGFRRTIVALSSEGPPAARRSRAVIVPTRGGARQIERALPPGGPRPELVTRDQFYDQLHQRLAEPPRRLDAFERDAVAQSAAAQSASSGPELSFRLRPGLVAAMLGFYDQLRRQSQTVQRFEELLEEALGDARADRGSARMLRQTRFLAGAFREYERRLAVTGACDEHLLRHRLIAEAAADPLRHVVVTVADWIAEPEGLFVADFDLLSRIPLLEAIDIVCTENVLGSGFHERVHQWLPGLDEIDGAGITGPVPVARPALRVPPGAPPDQPWFTHRDREEELADVARRVSGTPPSELLSTSVVFKHPLPYLYLAPNTLGAAGVAYQTADALPLAAEPATAALDIVLECVETDFTREAIVALLDTPHLQLGADGQPVEREGVSALSRLLSDRRYLGDFGRLEALHGEDLQPERRVALPAFDAAVTAIRELLPLVGPAPASRQIRRLLAFMDARARPLGADDPFAPRERRARGALSRLLGGLADAHERHHDPDWTIHELAPAIRRWIQEETFAPESAGEGLHLIDDQASRFGEFDDMTVVGLTESDWPDRPRRNIFYPPGLLRALGWPSERDRRSAADARFLDLVSSPARQVTLSTITLDDEALVNRSIQLEEISRARLSSRVDETADPRGPGDTPDSGRPATLSGAWLAMRQARSPADAPDFHGSIGPRESRTWRVSALETYIGCPFKFFAQHVLRLAEEPDDEEVMDPRHQGQLVHQVFEAFFEAWQKRGLGAITPDTLDQARSLFAEVVDSCLGDLPEAEAGLERTRLLGSPAAAGLGEAVFRMEAERPVAVVRRLLEHPLKGEFAMATSSGRRLVSLNGKADRLDLLADGTFRLIDYKLGWPPDRSKALQLAIYGVCAEQRLESELGRRWTLGEAAYLAFKGPRRVVPLFSTGASRDEVLAKAQQRLADTLDAIERGEFPPSPDDVFRCETCSFGSVCRKDYVGE